MSDLRTIDLNAVAGLMDFIRGSGYVLDFSDSTFSSFFAQEFNIDIDDRLYSDRGTSKGKRLRRCLELVDNKTARKILESLWELRQDHLLAVGGEDPVSNSQQRYNFIILRLSGVMAQSNVEIEPPVPAYDFSIMNGLRDELLDLNKMPPHSRGYAFEKFLKRLFEFYNLKPREPFRNVGEQIDGSFELNGHVYLLEAKWNSQLTGQADLLVLEGKLSSKAVWARRLFVSYTGFSEDGLRAFGSGRRSICVSGEDIWTMLDRRLPFDQVIDRKQRKAAETGATYIRLNDLF